MPFDARRAQNTLQASARLDAKLSEQAEASASAPSEAAAPESPPPAGTPARHFQRNTAPAESRPATVAPSAPAPTAGRFQRGGRPATPASPPAGSPPSTSSHFQRASTPGRAPAPPPSASTPRPQSRPAPSRPEAQYEQGAPTPHAAPLQSRGYANRVGAARATSVPGLTPRLELYIDELAFQKGWSNEDILRRKHEAAQRPVEAERDYRAQFDEIRRLRQETVQSLQQGVQSRPDQVVFVVQRGEQRRFSAMPKDRAGSYALLHGSAFYSMPASATLFEAPEVLFARPAPVAAVEDEPLAEAPANEIKAGPGSESAEGRPSRTPRP